MSVSDMSPGTHVSTVVAHVHFIHLRPKAFCDEDQKGAANHGSGALKVNGAWGIHEPVQALAL